MREDPDNHGGLFDGGDDLQLAAILRAMLDVDVEDALLSNVWNWPGSARSSSGESAN